MCMPHEAVDDELSDGCNAGRDGCGGADAGRALDRDALLE